MPSYELWSDYPDYPEAAARHDEEAYRRGESVPATREQEAYLATLLGLCLTPWIWAVVWLLGRGR